MTTLLGWTKFVKSLWKKWACLYIPLFATILQYPWGQPQGCLTPLTQSPSGWCVQEYRIHRPLVEILMSMKRTIFPDQGSWALRSLLGSSGLRTSGLETSFPEHAAAHAQVLPSPLHRISPPLFLLSLTPAHPLWTHWESSFGLVTYTKTPH